MMYASALAWLIVIIFAIIYSVYIMKNRDLDVYSKIDFYIILFSIMNIILIVMFFLASLIYPLYYFLKETL
jgi:hypothetical protein